MCFYCLNVFKCILQCILYKHNYTMLNKITINLNLYYIVIMIIQRCIIIGLLHLRNIKYSHKFVQSTNKKYLLYNFI